MRVLIVENTRNTDHGQVGRALAEADATVEVVKAFAGEALPADHRDHDAIVVFGGEQNARDDVKHPYLPRLADLMRGFGEADKAVLGICLGSQVLARAYGGENIIGAAPEFGWQAIAATEEGRRDPLILAAGAAEGGFHSFQWHDDTFSLPPGAAHLAENGTARHQAFRLGRAVYGTQFHFEAHRGVVEQWNSLFPEIAEAKRPGWIGEHHPREAPTLGERADAAGLAIARAWVALV
ncbi:type 1 glutamine amidotransferase [Ciceribacter sp. L1K23]|uniref:type 1 glutamine amidotransferase n=1 Tax=Ciceribacter sp. L1K23 TaxID=2820276 RepID=UPI001B81A086|nr:type 1 glutamine amidotransferase [Ciceribacter sp. L1K23]MBR0557418.1 type 1 glutamine amidotransferase [Ciceribacter sp. L1K23]